MADLASPGHPGWVVDEASGCWFWNALPKHGEVVTWTVLAPHGASGTCPGGPAAGRGRAAWQWLEDGRARRALAYGYYENGRLNGLGEVVAPNGERYEGNWRAGRPDGFGMLVFAPDAHGRELVAGAPPGTWRIRARRYEGEWRDGRPHGRGVVLFADGARFDGEFREGLADGPGEYASLRGPPRHGVWRRGCPVHSAGAEGAAPSLRFDGAGPTCPRRPAASASGSLR
ncbi:MORN repeat-containing protein [Dankookia rubra]|nr:hypothetical protein [Dankookia rubra]